MGLLDRLRRTPADSLRYSFAQWLSDLSFTYNGTQYGLGLNQTIRGNTEPIASDFGGLVAGAYKANGVIFACVLARLMLFKQARFQFRQLRAGVPGDLFGTPELQRLERPWPNGTTGDLLARALQDADLAGNFFGIRNGPGVKRLRPDWVDLLLDAEQGDPSVEVKGIMYNPGGRGSGREPIMFDVSQVVHFAPIPDPIASFRGMSWITPVIREVMADQAATAHKLTTFENGATPNMIVKLDVNSMEKFEAIKAKYREEHEGVQNASKTLFLASGADATVVGSDFRQLDFKLVQGAGETRIAAAAGVPPVIVGLSEGLQAATYSNYGQARRHFSELTMQGLWQEAAGSFASILNVPGGSELWFDERHIPYLREDAKDLAEIQQGQAIAIKALTDAGYTPESVVAAITAGDLSRLSHTGLYSVQLQPPMPDGVPLDLQPAAAAGRALAALIAPYRDGNGSGEG